MMASRPTRGALLYKILRRGCILLALGFFIGGGTDLSTFRVPGVLQRFGISYLVVGLIIAFVPQRNGSVRPAQRVSAREPASKQPAALSVGAPTTTMMMLLAHHRSPAVLPHLCFARATPVAGSR